MRTVSLYPGISMERFGLTPLAAPLYRLVFSDSRTDLLGGKWPDGNCEYREVPRYPGIKGQWIMERWMSPQDYAGTREAYERDQLDPESGLLTCGPYPHRGEYTYCHTFIGNPTEMQVGWAVKNNVDSRGLTPGQRKQGIMEPLENQKREQESSFDAIFDEAMGPFAKADTVVSFASGKFDRSGFKRASDMPMERFDQSAPLPTRDGFFGTIQRRDTIEKLTGE
jgi:hypothetical protein